LPIELLGELADRLSMNTLITLWTGILSALIPQVHVANHSFEATYTCDPLAWTTPATLGSDGHLRGVAQVECDFKALSGGGYPELENFLLASMKKQATHVNSGPIAGTVNSMPSQTYDFNMNLTFSGKQVDAHEVGTIATDEQTRLVSLMKTLQITGSSYDAYIKGFDMTLDVTPKITTIGDYHVSLSLAIDMTKPWYAPAGTFKSEVVKAVESTVTSYKDTMIGEIQNNI
jgi:hypothetical protein